MLSPQIVKRPEVETATGLSRSSLYRLAAAGQFPKPVKLSSRAVGWRADEISAWIEARTAERDSGRASVHSPAPASTVETLA